MYISVGTFKDIYIYQIHYANTIYPLYLYAIITYRENFLPFSVGKFKSCFTEKPTLGVKYLCYKHLSGKKPVYEGFSLTYTKLLRKSV